jgi:hypothetical protein
MVKHMVLPCLRGTTASFGGSLANPFGGIGDPAIGAVGEDLGSVGNAGAGGYPVTSAGGQPRGHHSIRLGIQELGHE